MHIGKFEPLYHTVFESLGCMVGFQLYLRLRKKDSLTASQRMPLIASCFLGALFGAKAINLAGDPAAAAAQMKDLLMFVGGKGIVGALLGGWLGVELAKAALKVKQATGDSFVLPLTAGILIGRIGCFLCGFYDHTYGVPTDLPWGVDFGDGIKRHPIQLYEILFLAGMPLYLKCFKAKLIRQGDQFKFFMCAYLGFRFFVEMLKPIPHVYFGLDAEQVAAVMVFALYHQFLFRLLKPNVNLTK